MLSIARVLIALLFTGPQVPQVSSAGTDPAISREQRIATLRATAQEQIAQERMVYSQQELDDIATRWRTAHMPAPLEVLIGPEAASVLSRLIADYPKSNRAGCAALKLARRTSGEERERELKRVIREFSGAWCESGAQVGAVARALLAVHYAGLEKYDDAERWAKEMVRLFPGAIEESGAPLDDVLIGIQLLRKE